MQWNLRATVEWSVGLLEDADVAAGGHGGVHRCWTIPAAAQGRGWTRTGRWSCGRRWPGTAWPLTTAPSRAPVANARDCPRFVAERLAVWPEAAEVGADNSGFYRVLAEQADRALRGRGGANGRSGWGPSRVTGAAVRWYLAHDAAAAAPVPGPVPVLVAAGPRARGRSWAKQLLPGFGTLDPQARAELAWAAAVLAGDIGDDAAALAARQRLAPLLPGIQDPFLHAVAQLAMAWTLPVAGDYGGALREAAASLEELRGQDEPASRRWPRSPSARLEITLGRYDDALRHLREARDLAEPVRSDWLAAGPVQLGILDVVAAASMRPGRCWRRRWT